MSEKGASSSATEKEKDVSEKGTSEKGVSGKQLLVMTDGEKFGIQVFEARNLPRLVSFLSKRPFFVRVTHVLTIKQTKALPPKEGVAKWDETLSGFALDSTAQVLIQVYAQRSMHEPNLVGTYSLSPEKLEARLNQRFSLDIAYVDPRGKQSAFEMVVMFKTSASTSKSSEKAASSEGAPVATPFVAELALDNMKDISGTANTVLVDSQLVVSAVTTTKAQYAIWEPMMEKVEGLVNIVDGIAAIHPYANIAWAILSAIPKAIATQMERDDSVRGLLEALKDMMDTVHAAEDLEARCHDPKQAEIITKMLQQTGECGHFIQSYAKDINFWKRLLKNVVSKADSLVTKYTTVLGELRDAFLHQTTITTKLCVLRLADDLVDIGQQLAEIDADALLRDLPYGDGARCNPAKGCTLGTRVQFLDHLQEWVHSPDSSRMLVLFGQAGSGKSSIAHEIARRFDEMGRLTSSFVFDKSFQQPPHLPITTLARDLSDENPSFKKALVKTIRGDTSLRLGNRDCRSLFSRLLLDQLKDLHTLGPMVIVIDGLDECDEETREGLVSALANSAHELPENFRMLLTARPESDLEEAFSNRPEIGVLRMEDNILAQDTEQDILFYTRSRLSPRLSDEDCIQLAQEAGRLFQWAAVACDFIAKPPRGLTASRAFDILVNKKGKSRVQEKLDELYDTVLRTLFPDFEKYEDIPIQFRFVMGQILASFEPLSQNSLIALGQHAPDAPQDELQEVVRSVVDGMGSLLSNVTYATSVLPMIPLHTSFRDYLTSKERSGAFFIDLNDADRLLTHACLGLMLDTLQFNICDLETSHFRNVHIPDLDMRVQKKIPFHLSYACRFWDEHIDHVSFDHDLLAKTESLLREKLLFWIEVLSLIGAMNLATPALATLRKWLAGARVKDPGAVSEEFADLVDDVSRFVRYFGMPIAESTPHIYLSAIPFSPSSSPVFQVNHSRLSNTFSVAKGHAPHWPTLQMQIAAHKPGKSVTSIAFSHNGRSIVSGSYDWNVSVWDAETGAQVLGPLVGHGNPIMSVAFSSDDRRIASGSEDNTVRIWDATTGDVIFTSFLEHEHGVAGVAFLPDSYRVLAFSRDFTTRIWDPSTETSAAVSFEGHANGVEGIDRMFCVGHYIAASRSEGMFEVFDPITGKRVAGPFTGHTSWIVSMALSSDGQRIASGSHDKSVRVWDFSNRNLLAGPLQGHTRDIYSVAFSPKENRYVASGSSDYTVRVWDVETGTCIAGPFHGHAGPVRAVSFSPDGHRVASGSVDQTICVWDLQVNGSDDDAPQAGHTDSITSLAFSPDGNQLVTGSIDHNIIQWRLDGTTEDSPVLRSFEGHTDGVTTIAYSPDGQFIASGSEDNTIRIWSAASGQLVGEPFEGHSQRVQSLKFSSDSQMLVSGSFDETVRVWNVGTRELIHEPFEGHLWGVLTVTFSPDDKRVAVGSRDSTIRVWDIETGETVVGPFPAHESWVQSIVYSPDGERIISGSDDNTLCVWNASTGEAIAGPFHGHNAEVVSVSLSSDGKRIASGSWDCSVCVWDAETGDIVAGPFNGHTSRINAVAFSPDDRYIASCSADRTIRIWDTTVGTKEHHGEDGREEEEEDQKFGDQHELEKDGWVRGTSGELLFWVPSAHRTTLARPSTARILNAGETRLDFTRFVHGEEWAKCYSG